MITGDIARARAVIAYFDARCEQEERDKAQMLRFIDAFPDALMRDNAMAHITASAWVVDSERTLALMAYHNIYKSWSWTGGHADGDSDLAAVALRETLEETGVRARLVTEAPLSIESLCVEGHYKRGAFVSPHIHMNVTYLLEADPKADTRLKPDENSGVMWIPYKDVTRRVSEEYMRGIYTKLMDRTMKGA